MSCHEVIDCFALHPGEPLPTAAEAHAASCPRCHAQLTAHTALLAALRGESAEVDDVARARWLARMSPEIDSIAARQQAPRRARGVMWFGLAAAATISLVVAWAGLRSPSGSPSVALDRDLLRPYVLASSTTSQGAASTYLGGRFAVLDVAANELVRATLDHDRGQRIAAVGPARIEITSASASEVALDMTGTLLVDQRSGLQITVRAGATTIVVQHATFAVSMERGGSPVIFVDRGELVVDGVLVGEGQWHGGSASAALIQLLREHEHAVEPPRGGEIVAIQGTGPVLTERGDVIGSAPLWVRLEARDRALVRTPSPPTVVAVAPEVKSEAVAPAPSARPRPPIRVDRAVPPATTADLEPVAETAAGLYAAAEAALGAGDHREAERIWRHLTDAFPSSREATIASYDLASLLRNSAPTQALRDLEKFRAGRPPAALREPAAYLACRLHVDTRDLAAAQTCFAEFRATFPRSTHDAEVLAWLAGRAEETTGCTGARALAAEYLRLYAAGSFAARARACMEAP